MVARDKALEIASLGHKVHVLVHGHDHNTVDFEQGIWVHRILPVESVNSEKAIRVEHLAGDVESVRAFLDELTVYRHTEVLMWFRPR